MCSVSCGKKEIFFFKTALNGFKLAYATKTMMNGIKVYVIQVTSPHQYVVCTGRSCISKHLLVNTLSHSVLNS